jgi:DNA-directed RNA polymerase specialized sigma24 family protein
VTLARGWYTPIARLVRNQLIEMGRHDLAGQADEVDGLVIDACFAIADRASGWRPGGASPWYWARRAIRADIARSIGHRTVEFDDVLHDCSHAPEPLTPELSELIERDPRFATFDNALRTCTSERNRRIVIEYLEQQAAGDPSPAHTVGQMFDVSPPAVRQVCSRALRKVRALVDRQPTSTEGPRAA